MNTLELFAGSQSFTKVAKTLGYNTFTSDIVPLEGIDYVVDVLDFQKSKVPFTPDIIWASPDCAAWSCVSGNRHYNANSLVPKTFKAEKEIMVISALQSIIDYFLTINKSMLYYIENPVGRLNLYLQPATLFSGIPRLVTLDQCQYGREFKKPTHIFTNDMNWQPKKRCPGKRFCHHEKLKNAGSGNKPGQALNLRYYERAKLPELLCYEILTQNKPQ